MLFKVVNFYWCIRGS